MPINLKTISNIYQKSKTVVKETIEKNKPVIENAVDEIKEKSEPYIDNAVNTYKTKVRPRIDKAIAKADEIINPTKEELLKRKIQTQIRKYGESSNQAQKAAEDYNKFVAKQSAYQKSFDELNK